MLKFRSLKFLALVLLLVPGSGLMAQEFGDTPIYLPEMPEAPPTTVARRRTVDAEYDDGTLRNKIDIAVMSDDSVVNDGNFVEYYRNGNKYAEGQYDMGVLAGEWSYWHDNGQLCKKVTFKEGRPHGEWKVYREDGSLEASKSYQNGKRHGEWTLYYDDGETPKLKISYQEGKVHGTRVSYHPDGNKYQEIQFQEGKMHGKLTEWTEQGRKRAEAAFVNGQKQGKTQYFDGVDEDDLE